MLLQKGETLFRQGEKGPLFRLNSGLLKIVRVHEDGFPVLVNIIVANEVIPHHSLISPTVSCFISSSYSKLPAGPKNS